MEPQHKLFDMNELLRPIEEEAQKDSPDINVFKDALESLMQGQQKLLNTVDYLQQHSNLFKSFYDKLYEVNYGLLVDKLRSIGYSENKDFKKNFENLGYRLMEQTRSGKRDDVFHGILRIYMSSKKSMPRELLHAFKAPTDEMFKVLTYSFLSGILSNTSNE